MGFSFSVAANCPLNWQAEPPRPGQTAQMQSKRTAPRGRLSAFGREGVYGTPERPRGAEETDGNSARKTHPPARGARRNHRSGTGVWGRDARAAVRGAGDAAGSYRRDRVMRTRLVVGLLTLVGLLAGAGAWAYPRDGHCSWCDTKLECWSSQICGKGCVCAQNDPGKPGRCTAVSPDPW